MFSQLQSLRFHAPQIDIAAQQKLVELRLRATRITEHRMHLSAMMYLMHKQLCNYTIHTREFLAQ